MNTKNKKPDTVTPQDKLKARITFVVIIAVFLIPYLIAPMFFNPEKMDKLNKGILIQPHVQFDDLLLKDETGDPFDTQSIKDRWSMLYILPKDCSAACNNSMYSIRQVKKTLGRDIYRVKNIIVTLSEPSSAIQKNIDKEFSSFTHVMGTTSAIDAAFNNALTTPASSAGYIYLVSPDGQIFIYYPSYENEHESILKAEDIRLDLRRTLKGSRI